MKIKIRPFTAPLDAHVVLPGSKSITNRVYLYAALATGKTVFKGALISEDTAIMRTALKQFGVKIHGQTVWGGSFSTKGRQEIFCGNAGTATRFLVAVAALREGETVFFGKERMHARPIEPLLTSLRDLGVDAVSVNGDGCPPVIVRGTGKLRGGKTAMRGDLSSQFFSALLAMAPLAQNPVEIEIIGKLVSLPYLEMTIALLKSFGITIDFDGRFLRVKPQQYKTPGEFRVEGDASAASHLLGICAARGGRLAVSPLPADSLQGDTRFAAVLEKMGCKITHQGEILTIERHGALKPLGEINLEAMPDAAMTACVLAPLAKGVSLIKGLSTLRLKETDRIAALATELRKMGAEVEAGNDYLKIVGGKPLHGTEIETYDDHRMAMCFTLLGTVVPGVIIHDPACVKKTFPAFWRVLAAMRLRKALKKRQNIVFTGLRCSGKTQIGKLIAKKLGWDFLDTDKLVEQKEGVKISEIVAQKGWDYFREREHEACKEAAKKKKAVIALGGGAITFPRNATFFKNSLVVFLKVPLSELAHRIASKNDRPSLTGAKQEQEMADLWRARKEAYEATADITVRCAAKTVGENGEKVYKEIKKIGNFPLTKDK